MDISRIPPRSKDGHTYVLVEIPQGSQNKYELDAELGVITFDRALYSATHYPTEYGLVPGTRSSDGEMLDALVMVERPTFPGCLTEIRLLGVLTITHTSGKREDKLLGVPVREPRFDEFQDLPDIPEHLLKEIENFFHVYKELEGSHIGTAGWRNAREAQSLLDEAIQAFKAEGAEA
jgi:inorganic pyrophosphatase